jgi:uncharacterized protein (DUF427 family)
MPATGHQIDLVPSTATVRVELDGELLAESTHALELRETGLPSRWYLPAEDVRAEALRPSDTHTHCPFKGDASYHSVQTAAGLHPDVIWFYPEPNADVEAIRDRLCFYDEKVSLTVDGGPA